MAWEETQDYIRSGHRDQSEFEPDSLRTIWISEEEGIRAVIGKPKDKTATEVVSYLFMKEKDWTPDKAKVWFHEHHSEARHEHLYCLTPILEKIVEKPLKIRGIALTAGMSRNLNVYMDEELESFAPKLVGSPVYLEHVSAMNAVGRVTSAAWDPDSKVLFYGAEIPVGTEDYDSITLTPRKYGVRPLISREMVEDAEWDVIEYQLAEAGRAMADLETEKIVTQLISDAGNSVAAATSGTLAYTDVVDILKECLIDDFTPDVLVINPTELADLLTDTAIQKAIEWGGPPVAPSGTVTRLLGMRVLVSTKVTSGTALAVDSKHAGVLFIRRDITAEDYEDPVKDLAGVAVTARWAYATLRADAIGKITGC